MPRVWRRYLGAAVQVPRPGPPQGPAPVPSVPEELGRDESVKQIVVVERDRQKLYEYVKRAFSGNASVDVVLDRRRSERRGAGDRSRAPDRRRGDRRLMNEIDNHLRALGWAVVRLDVFRTLGLAHRASR